MAEIFQGDALKQTAKRVMVYTAVLSGMSFLTGPLMIGLVPVYMMLAVLWESYCAFKKGMDGKGS